MLFYTKPVRNSIAMRLALMFAVAALVGFALVGVALHLVVERELTRHRYEEVRDRLEDVRFVLEHERSLHLDRFAHDMIQVISASGTNARFWLWSKDPAYRYGDEAESIARRFQQPGQSGRVFDLAVGPDGKRLMVVTGVALPANDIRPALILMAGVDFSFVRALHTFELSLVLGTLFGAGLVATLGYWIARVGLRPLRRMSADAQSIGPDNQGQRLALSLLPRELLDLGRSFNAALDRYDGAYRQLEAFNANVAHELRTPLANLIGQTQVTLAREREAAVLREVLESNLEELERLRTIIATMLFLARAEQGERALRRVDASIAGEVSKVVEFLDVLLEEARMRVTVDGDAVAPLEGVLFRRALANLLQNAIQYSPPGSDIQVHITQDAHSATVAFSNPGGPIAPEQITRLFERFYRIDIARGNSGKNHGLGLAIVKAVAAMHGGAVFANSQDGIVTVGFSVSRP